MTHYRRVQLVAQLLTRVAAGWQQIHESQCVVGKIDSLGAYHYVEARYELALAKECVNHSLDLFAGIFHGGLG